MNHQEQQAYLKGYRKAMDNIDEIINEKNKIFAIKKKEYKLTEKRSKEKDELFNKLIKLYDEIIINCELKRELLDKLFLLERENA